MVGDSIDDDIEGARALGMRAILLDREGRTSRVRAAARRPARPAGGARPRAALGTRQARRYDRLVVSDWLIWVLVAVALAIGEIATPGSLLPRAGRARRARGGAWSPRSAGLVVVQLIVFVVGSLASLALLRPIARSASAHAGRSSGPAPQALVGARALVLQRVDADGGRVKIGGEEWSARAFDGGAGARAGRAGRGGEDRGRDGARLRIGGPRCFRDSSPCSWSSLFVLLVAVPDGPDRPAGARGRGRAPRPLLADAHARASRSSCRSSTGCRD